MVFILFDYDYRCAAHDYCCARAPLRTICGGSGGLPRTTETEPNAYWALSEEMINRLQNLLAT